MPFSYPDLSDIPSLLTAVVTVVTVAAVAVVVTAVVVVMVVVAVVVFEVVTAVVFAVVFDVTFEAVVVVDVIALVVWLVLTVVVTSVVVAWAISEPLFLSVLDKIYTANTIRIAMIITAIGISFLRRILRAAADFHSSQKAFVISSICVAPFRYADRRCQLR